MKSFRVLLSIFVLVFLSMPLGGMQRNLSATQALNARLKTALTQRTNMLHRVFQRSGGSGMEEFSRAALLMGLVFVGGSFGGGAVTGWYARGWYMSEYKGSNNNDSIKKSL